MAMAQRARGIAYWRRAMEASVERANAVLEADFSQADRMRHWWRPPRENTSRLARAAKAAGVFCLQLRLKKPLKILYDEQAEVPIQVMHIEQPSRSIPGKGPSRSTNGWTGEFARQNLDNYQVRQVLQEIYEHEQQQVVKAGGDGGPKYLFQCRSGATMLRTYQKAGSVVLMEFGTCFVKNKYVVVDIGPWFKVQLDKFVIKLSRRLWPPLDEDWLFRMFVPPTHVSLLTISKSAFEASSCTLFRDPDNGFMPGEVLGLRDELGGRAAVKVAVEIDRTMLGMGNIVFFEPVEVVDDVGKVWDRLAQLDKSIRGCSLDGLKLHQLKDRYDTFQSRAYVLIPEFLDPEKDLPFEYFSLVF